MTVEYALYERRSGPGPNWLCRPLVDDKERLIFTGTTAEAAEGAARAWYAKNFEPKSSPPRKREEAATEADIFG